MQYFKDGNNKVFAYEDGVNTAGLGLTPMSEAEALMLVESQKPEPTAEQIASKAKLVGVEFDGVMCSAAAEDMWGLVAVKSWLEAGNATNFKFANGNTLALSADNLADFEAVWVPFRASFFE